MKYNYQCFSITFQAFKYSCRERRSDSANSKIRGECGINEKRENFCLV